MKIVSFSFCYIAAILLLLFATQFSEGQTKPTRCPNSYKYIFLVKNHAFPAHWASSTQQWHKNVLWSRSGACEHANVRLKDTGRRYKSVVGHTKPAVGRAWACTIDAFEGCRCEVEVHGQILDSGISHATLQGVLITTSAACMLLRGLLCLLRVLLPQAELPVHRAWAGEACRHPGGSCRAKLGTVPALQLDMLAEAHAKQHRHITVHNSLYSFGTAKGATGRRFLCSYFCVAGAACGSAMGPWGHGAFMASSWAVWSSDEPK